VINNIFIAISLILGVVAVMLICKNFIAINKLNKAKRTIQNLHPELENIQPGDQLMSVNFGEENEDEDPLYRSLKDRINELNEEDDEEDDDDDDGDVIVRV
jgi:hypothetical protein